MITIETIEDRLVRRMAARIRVQPFWAENYPYLAELRLVRAGATSASGHPFMLWASATSPSQAIEQGAAPLRRREAVEFCVAAGL